MTEDLHSCWPAEASKSKGSSDASVYDCAGKVAAIDAAILRKLARDQQVQTWPKTHKSKIKMTDLYIFI